MKKIYLDTSVLDHLCDTNRPDFTECTRRLWEKCKTQNFQVFVSAVTYEELKNASVHKRNLIEKRMMEFQIWDLLENEEAEKLAEKYIGQAIGEKQRNDRRHLAYATVYECETLVSWNFSHLVRDHTNKGARKVNLTNKYDAISIVSPAMLLGEEENPWPASTTTE
jgi:predicted nucleic acid-binding protein